MRTALENSHGAYLRRLVKPEIRWALRNQVRTIADALSKIVSANFEIFELIETGAAGAEQDDVAGVSRAKRLVDGLTENARRRLGV